MENQMNDVKFYPRDKVRFSPLDSGAGSSDDGQSALANLVGPLQSETLGAGLVRFDNCSIEWTLLSDEVLVVLHGKFRLRYGEQLSEVIEAGAGDVLWLPKKTHVAYEGEKVELFYSVYPGNWRTLHGLPERADTF